MVLCVAGVLFWREKWCFGGEKALPGAESGIRRGKKWYFVKERGVLGSTCPIWGSEAVFSGRTVAFPWRKRHVWGREVVFCGRRCQILGRELLL